MARIEKDFLGEKELPDTAYYGVQTLRGKENFHITGIAISECLMPGLPTRSLAPVIG